MLAVTVAIKDAGLEEEGEVFGNVGLRGARGGLDNLGDGLWAEAEGLQDAQASGFAEGFEEGGDPLELSWGKGLGLGGLTHNQMSILLYHMNAPSFPVATSGSPRSVAPRALQGLRQSGQACVILDVRTPAEFDSIHVDGTHSIPLQELGPETLSRIPWSRGTPLYLLCQSGGRATRAAQQLAAAGVEDCVVVEGGVDAWIGAGLPVERGGGTVLPLMRQVQIVVGSVSGVGAALALWKDARFAWIPLLMGAGLLFAGVTGTCGLALVLARMPWNQRSRQGAQKGATSGARGDSGGACCAGGAR